MSRELLEKNTSRRKLLLGLGVGAVGTAALAAPALKLSWVRDASQRGGSWWDRSFSSLAHGGRDEWSRIVGESFSVAGENGSTLLKLVAIKPLRSDGKRPADVARRSAFAAVFEAENSRAPSGDRIYEMSHDSYAAIPVHMSGPAVAGGKAQLVAVFN